MAQTIQPVKFDETVREILNDYDHDVNEIVEESIEEVAKDAQKTLKKAGTFNGKDYKRAWATKIEKKRIYTTATIYNKKPGLTHLLEFGHVKQNGGRTRAFPHIAPVNEQVQTEVVQNIEEKLK